VTLGPHNVGEQVLVRGVVLKHRQTIEEIEPDVPERILAARRHRDLHLTVDAFHAHPHARQRAGLIARRGIELLPFNRNAATWVGSDSAKIERFDVTVTPYPLIGYFCIYLDGELAASLMGHVARVIRSGSDVGDPKRTFGTRVRPKWTLPARIYRICGFGAKLIMHMRS
jgi:hypothetical protein